MKQKFNSPQRQSAVGIVIMFADTLQKFLRAMWAPLAIMIYRMPSDALLYVVFGVLVLFLIIGFVAYLKYRNFTFFLDENKQEFVVQSGVLSKKRLSIGLDKIQQVNINQNIIQKIIGVYSLDVDTAGSGSKEVSIRAIDHKSAQILKAKLLERDAEKSEVDETSETPEEPQKPIIKISLSSLLKVGITSNYGRSLAILMAFFFTLYDNAKDFIQNEMLSEEQFDTYINQGAKLGLLMIFFGLFLAVFVINLVRTLIKYFDLEVVKQRNSLLISYGLFAKKNTLLNPKKAQIVSYSQNFFQQKMNVLKMQIKQASSQEIKEDGKKNETSVIEIQGANSSEKELILKAIYDKIAEKGTVFNPNYRYVFRGVLFGLIVPILVFLIAGFFVNEEIKTYFPFIGLYVLIVGLLIYFGFKNYKLFVNDDFIIKKSGAWDVKHQIIEPHKIQAVTTRQFFWHKPSDVGHIILHTAGGDIYFNFANFSQINKQINYWLYQVESSDKHWM